MSVRHRIEQVEGTDLDDATVGALAGQPAGFTVEPVDARSTPDDVLRAMYSVATQIEREDVPEPPWTPESEWVAGLRADAGIQDRADWLVRDATGEPVAVGHFHAHRTGETPGQAHRAGGAGCEAPGARGPPPASRRKLGARRRPHRGAGLDDRGGRRRCLRRRLRHRRRGRPRAQPAADELDPRLLADWVGRARARAADYDLVGWDGPCPSKLRAAYAEVRQVMNTAPQTSDHVDEVCTVDKLDELEGSWLEAGLPWWTLCARHLPSGRLVGFTELAFSVAEPALGYQGDTAVDLAHRERGLGRWLKGALLQRALDECPELEVIDTYNAGSNDAMITINRALGFGIVLRTERRHADLAELMTRLR